MCRFKRDVIGYSILDSWQAGVIISRKLYLR
jgi:hypothetical protein